MRSKRSPGWIPWLLWTLFGVLLSGALAVGIFGADPRLIPILLASAAVCAIPQICKTWRKRWIAWGVIVVVCPIWILTIPQPKPPLPPEVKVYWGDTEWDGMRIVRIAAKKDGYLFGSAPGIFIVASREARADWQLYFSEPLYFLGISREAGFVSSCKGEVYPAIRPGKLVPVYCNAGLPRVPVWIQAKLEVNFRGTEINAQPQRLETTFTFHVEEP